MCLKGCTPGRTALAHAWTACTPAVRELQALGSAAQARLFWQVGRTMPARLAAHAEHFRVHAERLKFTS